MGPVLWRLACVACAAAAWVLTPVAIALMAAVKLVHRWESHAETQALYGQAMHKVNRSKRAGVPR